MSTPRRLRRIATGALVAGTAWLVAVWPPPVWWRAHWPRQTAMMRWSARHTAPADVPTPLAHAPIPLDAMGSDLPTLVVLAEDARFPHHWGIDAAEIRDATGVAPGSGPVDALRALWRRRARMRGASTITQQLAKNLYLSPSRNPLRKIKEAVTAVRLEGALSKERILELYLNTVELGPGLWGVHAASHAYFGIDPDGLTVEQAAALAATLPHPRTSNPAHRPGRMLARQRLILARYRGSDVELPAPDLPGDTLPVIPFTPPLVPPGLDTVSVSVPATPAPDSVRPIPR